MVKFSCLARLELMIEMAAPVSGGGDDQLIVYSNSHLHCSSGNRFGILNLVLLVNDGVERD